MKHDLELRKLIIQNGIEDLLARFDDAVIRNDAEAFRSLWAENGVWEISKPVPMRAAGHEEIVATLEKFHRMNQFFFRSTSRPVIHADGDLAEFRSPSVELGRREGNIGYSNVAMYYDKAQFDGERWRFIQRFYQYLWVDITSKLDGESVPLSLQQRGGTQPEMS